MNIFLWILQVLMAFHTLTGGIWKFSKSIEETMPSLAAIPPSVWITMGVIEIICAIALILPALKSSFKRAAPVAAILIAVEMFALCAIHTLSGSSDTAPMIYWLVVAAICAFIAFGRRKALLAN